MVAHLGWRTHEVTYEVIGNERESRMLRKGSQPFSTYLFTLIQNNIFWGVSYVYDKNIAKSKNYYFE